LFTNDSKNSRIIEPKSELLVGQIMKNTRLLVVITTLALLLTSVADAATREEKRVADAADVIDQLSRIPERSIPPSLLSRAYAVAVIPNVVRAAFGLGARRGKGVLVVRQDDNSWSNPAFVTLTGGSVGWQIGAESTDVILVFKTRKGVDGIENGKLTLGANASVAAGPVGRHTSFATDIEFKAEVYSYSRSRGLFAGIALEGWRHHGQKGECIVLWLDEYDARENLRQFAEHCTRRREHVRTDPDGTNRATAHVSGHEGGHKSAAGHRGKRIQRPHVRNARPGRTSGQ
jgi:lipid-binding SYLF domain-containing protein